jgi:hypothetical protein
MDDEGQELLDELDQSGLWRCDCETNGRDYGIIGYKDYETTRVDTHPTDCGVVHGQQIQAWHRTYWGRLTPPQRKSLQKILRILIDDLSLYHKKTYQEMLQLDDVEGAYLTKALVAYEKGHAQGHPHRFD